MDPLRGDGRATGLDELEDGADGLGRDIRIAGTKTGFGVSDLPERVVDVNPAIVGYRFRRGDSDRSERGASTDTHPWTKAAGGI